ncbi:MAG: type II toxin-antitoxin system HicA family toxin [Candidatus Diapherotrites archaeon]|nr:type II toxin-antitoxin system HicA family toxin [Candidatus Diapherotrites archaeon]
MKLPVVSGRDAVKAFSRVGWKPTRQRGSHVVLEKAGEEIVLTIPLHNELKKGLLHGLIKDAGLSVAAFTRLL